MLIEATPRRFRPKVWLTLVMPILAAVPILAWAGINPLRRDPAAVALDHAKVWAGVSLENSP